MTGAAGFFRRRVRAGVEAALLYAVDVGGPAAAGARLSNWLEVAGAGRRRPTGERVEEFLRPSRYGALAGSVVTSGPAVPAGCAATAGGARRRGPMQAGSSTDAVLASFERTLLTERGLGAGTARVTCVTSPVPGPGCRPAALPEVTAADVMQAVLRRVHGGLGERDAILRRRVWGLAALLRCRGVDAHRPVQRPAGDRPATFRCLKGSLPPRPGLCSRV